MDYLFCWGCAAFFCNDHEFFTALQDFIDTNMITARKSHANFPYSHIENIWTPLP